MLVVIASGVWWAVKSFSPVAFIDISQKQIQAQLDPHFPRERCLLAACLEIREPKLSMNAGSERLGFTARLVATLGQRTMSGTTAFSGVPRYNERAGSFYLDDVRVSQFEMSGNAPDFDEAVKLRGPGIMAAILQNIPLYTLSPDSERESLAKWGLRSVQVVDGKLRIRFINPMAWFE